MARKRSRSSLKKENVDRKAASIPTVLHLTEAIKKELGGAEENVWERGKNANFLDRSLRESRKYKGVIYPR
jgi:hypothetical protein